MPEDDREIAAILEAAEKWAKVQQEAAGRADQSAVEAAKAKLIDAVRAWRASRRALRQ